ncbi:general secretion pathway protein E [Litoreibacter meonggei]|uniref:General secretion pathway protein E n=1 Tax=Litoreibacter meonggei TaxID=1049199 RepID=A0A497X623_9RHOB|nr:general secretion pathway protein E [Litoreibacter meonggei]
MRDFNDSDFAGFLVENSILSKTDAERALTASSRSNTSFERTIMELGLASETQLFAEIADWLDVPICQPDVLDRNLVRSYKLERGFLERVEAVPLYKNDAGEVVIATSDPRGQDALQSISFHLGLACTAAIATRSTIKASISALFDTGSSTDILAHGGEVDVLRLQALANDGPVISQVNDLIAEAVDARASDIHIEVLDASARVRIRVDGELRLHRQLNQSECATFISRLKIMGRMNISEKRRPQDGRARISVQGRNIDLRLATLPTQHGESMVVRVLDKAQIDLTWDALGYPLSRVAEIEEIINKPNGIFLVAGPVGSGKTTTLYTALSQINSDNRKIITVEDPIEYSIEGVSQVQVQPEIDMTFARALRAILRQDPNVVLIGEIRDEETAEIAVRAALLGRLVLSTVHTNDALSAIDRLIDLGVPPYLLGATLRGVLSQRLVRRICTTCGGSGCETCLSSGYKGRRVVSELMTVTDAGGREIAQMVDGSALSPQASIRNFDQMSDVASRLLAANETSLEEVAKLSAF